MPHMQWRRQLWGTGARAPSAARLPTILFLVHFGVNLTANYPMCSLRCWCRCQQLAALSISTALVAKLLVINQLLHPALKFAVSAPCFPALSLLATNPGDATAHMPLQVSYIIENVCSCEANTYQ